jgi:hypothetical protein
MVTVVAANWWFRTVPLTFDSSLLSDHIATTITTSSRSLNDNIDDDEIGSPRSSTTIMPEQPTSPRLATSANTFSIPKTQRTVYKNLPASHFTNLTVLTHNDPIYTPGAWDGAPVVLEQHKLLFFTTPKVGCTVWKQLFRRVAGLTDWQMPSSEEDNNHPPLTNHQNPQHLPHNPLRNGLTYLYHYPPDVADAMLTDPTWTRAIFVRDPKERLLSAYLDKAVSERQYMMRKCCPKADRPRIQRRKGQRQKQRQRPAAVPQSPKQAKMHQLLQCWTTSSPQQLSGLQQQQQQVVPPLPLSEFVDTVVPACPDPHWQPQSAHISDNVWSTINFVGHMDAVETDAAALLQRTGLWDDFGAHGWGGNGDGGGSMFHDTRSVYHATDSAHRLREYYNTEALEKVVERLYRSDYENPIMNLTRKRILLEEDEGE